jgi:flap endonuclease-1
MGVKGLTKLLQNYAPNSISQENISKYSGTTQAIDIFLTLYKFIIAIRNSGKDITRSDGKMTSHIYGIFNKMLNLLDNGVLPYPVFDGKAPSIKNKTLKERKDIKTKAQTKLNDTDNILSEEERIKLYKRSFSITNDHIKEVQKLINLMGLEYLQAPGEADPQCAALNIVGKVNGVITEDMDTLAFGAPLMLRNFSSKKKIMEINLEKVLIGLELSYDQFLDICIILGSDYSKPIRGLNSLSVYKKYKNFGKMESFLEHLENKNKELISQGKSQKYIIPDNFKESWIKAKQYYKQADVWDPREVEISWKEPNFSGLLKFLCEENEFNEKEISNKLKKLHELYRSYSKYGRLLGKIYYPKENNKSITRSNKVLTTNSIIIDTSKSLPIAL